MATIESRIRNAQAGLVCVAAGAIGVVFFAVDLKVEGKFNFPHYFLLFILLGDAYAAGVFVWMIRRLRKEQSAKGKAKGQEG
jgi:hypothetical protein